MEILNVKELAEYLKCSNSVIRSLVRKKKIPNFRIGAKLNFNKEAIDLWIHEQEIGNMQEENTYQDKIKPIQKVGVFNE